MRHASSYITYSRCHVSVTERIERIFIANSNLSGNTIHASSPHGNTVHMRINSERESTVSYFRYGTQ